MQIAHPDDNTGTSCSGVFATGIYASAMFGAAAGAAARAAVLARAEWEPAALALVEVWASVANMAPPRHPAFTEWGRFCVL